MIEMPARAVARCPRSGKPAAALEPRVATAYPSLALAVTAGEAHTLIHELRAQDTLRAQAFALMARVPPNTARLPLGPISR